MRSKLTQLRLMERFVYDPKTGDLRYKKNNTLAGYDDGRGYLLTIIDGERHYNHRLAWLYTHGYLPENIIDHINRNPSDNRIANLRETSPQCNIRNSRKPKHNTSGVKGVHWQPGRHIWEAYITINGKRRHLGKTKNKIEAVMLRYLAEQSVQWYTCSGITSACQYLLSEGRNTSIESYATCIWQQWHSSMDVSPKTVEYLYTGLLEEIGEFAGKFKRFLRGESVCPTHVLYEVGDILWNTLQLCTMHNISIKELHTVNTVACRKVADDFQPYTELLHLQRASNALYTKVCPETIYSFVFSLLVLTHNFTHGGIYDVLLLNRFKLSKRYATNKIIGSGDNR